MKGKGYFMITYRYILYENGLAACKLQACIIRRPSVGYWHIQMHSKLTNILLILFNIMQIA